MNEMVKFMTIECDRIRIDEHKKTPMVEGGEVEHAKVERVREGCVQNKLEYLKRKSEGI